MPPAHAFDDDKLREECGVFGVIGTPDSSNFVALGLHALQHRGQEAGGIVSHDSEHGFNSARRFGYVRDNFTSKSVMDTLARRCRHWSRALFYGGIQRQYGHPRRTTVLW